MKFYTYILALGLLFQLYACGSDAPLEHVNFTYEEFEQEEEIIKMPETNPVPDAPTKKKKRKKKKKNKKKKKLSSSDIILSKAKIVGANITSNDIQVNFDPTAITMFQTLADKTEGELYLSEDPNHLITTIIEVLNNRGGDDMDIAFLIDKTGSMMDDITTIQNSMDVIFKALKQYNNINLAMGYYGDKNIDGDNWLEIYDFSKDYNTIETQFKSVVYSGGGDVPESATDGAYRIIDELNWTSDRKRIVLLIGDAPSLRPPLADYTIGDLIEQAQKQDIVSNYYPIIVALQHSVVVDYTGGSGVASSATTSSDSKPEKITKAKLISNVYPNPATDVVNIELSEAGNYQLVLVDGKGQLITREEIEENTTHQINVSSYAAGAYTLHILNKDTNEKEAKRVIVAR